MVNVDNIKSKLSFYFNEKLIPIYKYLKSDEGLSYIALAPLLFSWLFVLSVNFEKPKVRESCLYSCIFSIYFFLLFLLSIIVDNIPFIGNTLANFFHLVAILTYFGLSLLFIYSLYKNKKVEIIPLKKHYTLLDNFLIDERP